MCVGAAGLSLAADRGCDLRCGLLAVRVREAPRPIQQRMCPPGYKVPRIAIEAAGRGS